MNSIRISGVGIAISGWLRASPKRAGLGDGRALIGSTLGFTAWHPSAILLHTSFDVPAAEIPIFLVNAALIGGVHGIIRLFSGSLIASSVCHAIWNGIAYTFCGFGDSPGALGTEQTHLYGPEVGLPGIPPNLAFFIYLWRIMSLLLSKYG